MLLQVLYVCHLFVLMLFITYTLIPLWLKPTFLNLSCKLWNFPCVLSDILVVQEHQEKRKLLQLFSSLNLSVKSSHCIIVLLYFVIHIVNCHCQVIPAIFKELYVWTHATISSLWAWLDTFILINGSKVWSQQFSEVLHCNLSSNQPYVCAYCIFRRVIYGVRRHNPYSSHPSVLMDHGTHEIYYVCLPWGV